MALEAASSSSSALSLPKKYDVLISFRGEDTRSNFTGHLYKALCDKQIRTFMDDQELPKGDDISPSLVQAIEDSYISVVVFSENYASSKWCLDELVHILHCKRGQGQIVVPVFYNVDPSHVRNQMGPYKQAFVRYEADPKVAQHKIQMWKQALHEAANVSGFDSSKFKFDYEMIKDIVNDILHKLNRECQAGTVGKWGRGAIGKSEVAKTIFSSSRYSSRYEGSCFLETNRDNDFNVTYIEFPNHFVYDRSDRIRKRRRRGYSVGRMTHVSPSSSGELYYLRILPIKGPTSYDDLKTIDGILYRTSKGTCFACGLLNDDTEYISAIKEAAVWATGNTLRKLFVNMLSCSSLQQPENVWKQTKNLLAEDLSYVTRLDPIAMNVTVLQNERDNAALIEIDKMLQMNGKCLKEFPSMPLPNSTTPTDMSNHLILQELNYDRNALRAEADKLIEHLNNEQRHIYDRVMSSLAERIGGFFFVYGHGGTGKTFLWNALISSIRASGDIVLPVASSGIAAALLPSGRTAHSRFVIPIQICESSVCSIRQNSPLANLLIQTKLIIWDEAPMVQRFCVEAFDRTLRDIMRCDRPFGGKCIIMGGDFRQILPVIPKSSRGTLVDASINSSYLWEYCTIFTLKRNMRLSACSNFDENEKLHWFPQWLLDVGDGKIGDDIDGISEIEIPSELLICHKDDPIRGIVESTYPNLLMNLHNNDYFNDRAILASTIDMAQQINDYMCSLLPGVGQEYSSCDFVCKSSDDTDSIDNLCNTEFLNTINCSGLPPHKLVLKVGTPIMLLRNIDQSSGLFNGTRLRVTHLGKTIIEAVMLNGSHPNQKVLIHRMNMNPSENRWPFRMQRRQFPISISFAMTINKSQGQSLCHVGIFLSKPVFTHGQLYVALSRVKSIDGLRIFISNGDDGPNNKTTNVVYREIFRNVIV